MGIKRHVIAAKHNSLSTQLERIRTMKAQLVTVLVIVVGVAFFAFLAPAGAQPMVASHLNDASFSSRGSGAILGLPIVLPYSGMVRVTIRSIDPNALCPGSFGIYSPINYELWWNYRDSVGETKEIGFFSAGTELVFYIAPRGFCDNFFLSTGDHCRVTVLGEGAWRLVWEDWTDWDWNDVVVEINMVTEDLDLELARRFAPYMYFHQDDIYRPISVTVPVEKAQLINYDEGGRPVPAKLAALVTSEWNKENTYIDLKGNGQEELHNVYQNEISPLVEPLAFVHVDRTSTPDKIAVQYWLFYYDNPWRNHHEGDWEMVEVVLDGEENPLYAVYSQHISGSKRWWRDVEKEGNHLVVYVARGSHASYFKPYDYFQGVEPLGGIDETAPAKREGVVSVQLLPASLTQDTWLYFKGHWGDRGKGAQWFYFDEDGPRGPSQKKGEKWDNPVAWSESLPWDEEAHHNLVRKLCASVLAPLDVHFYELPSQAHVGWKEGKLELGIADAEYFDNPAGWRTILLHEVNPEFEYKVELGYRAPTYQMGTQVASEEIIVALSFPDVEASTVIVALYSLTGIYGVSTTATISVYHGSDFNMRIDIDGDETIDEEVAPIAMEEIPTDFTAPSVITDLEVLTSTIGSVVLSWTAPGDDGDIGTAAAYDLRYYATPITESNWVSATQVISPPIPSLAGITDVFTVTGIPGGVYYFALKARDDLLQSSGLSNVVETEVPYGLYLPVVLRNH